MMIGSEELTTNAMGVWKDSFILAATHSPAGDNVVSPTRSGAW
jgi:hypothetical protein